MVVLCHSMSLRDLHISIHVPAWGTTIYTLEAIIAKVISIHVPAWGTTWRFPADEGVDRYFNPRSRVGNDMERGLICIGN